MDKLAVVQSKETIAELEEIDKKTTELIGTFERFVDITNKAGTSFKSGTPKEYAEAAKSLQNIEKEAISIKKELLEIEKRQQQVSILQTNAKKAESQAKSALS